MGRFSTTLHIKCGKARFEKAFAEVMKKRGFTFCDEDEAAVSYFYACGGDWVTLTNEGYGKDTGVYDDARELAAALNTSAFSVEVVDSDFADLRLFGENEDKAIVGDGMGYGVANGRGDREKWKPLIAAGKTFDMLAELWEKRDVEKALYRSAEVFGIIPEYMSADFDELSEKEAVPFFFKKFKTKNMSLNAAFFKVFGEALEPLGYKKIKSKYPYFVRVVTDEIIHVISYNNYKRCYDPGHNYIIIQGGVATVYRARLDLTHTPKMENWLRSNCDFYNYWIERNSLERDEELTKRLYSNPSSPEEPFKAMESELELAKRFMLPALAKAVSIETCIEHGFGMDIFLYDDGCFGATYGNSYYNDGLIYFKTDRSVFDNIFKNARSDFAMKQKAYFERVHADHELYAEVQAELERRKAVNTEVLRSYGAEI